MYNNKKILILGAAKSGCAVAKLLAKYNNEIVLSDLKSLSPDVTLELESLGIKIIITDDQCSLIDNSWDLVIKNPAIMYTSDIVKKCQELNLRVENEMEVAYHFLPKDVTIIGITGSNGKTTTSTILYESLLKSGLSVRLVGNIGIPLAQDIDNIKEKDILVMEISDHQLCDIHDFKTNISILTNIVPTHLDYHGTYEHYKHTKSKIFNRHTNKDLAIINYDNKDALSESSNILSTKMYFSSTNSDVLANYHDGYLCLGKEKVINTEDIVLKGIHNYENILAVMLVFKYLNIDYKYLKEFLKDFTGVEHRLELVLEKDNVKYYNDSKSTNPTSTITALKTFKSPIHLILGGLNRNQDFQELDGYLDYVKTIYALGEVTDIVDDFAKKHNIPCYKCYTLAKCIEEVLANVEDGDIVLLSPASSSQDQYAKFEDRGKEFKELVLNKVENL